MSQDSFNFAASLQLAKDSNSLDSNTLANIENWFSDELIDSEDKAAVATLIENKKWTEVLDAFFQKIAFGTGGLRGVVGNGSNRMNRYLIQKVTQGLANYVSSAYPNAEKSAVIAYDSRIYSKAFSTQAACIFAANGIKTFLFDTYETTPCLSYAVRDLNCQVGICMTASHNPPEYAGYKVYAEDGAQIVSPSDKLILEEVAQVSSLSKVKVISEEKARETGLISSVPNSVIEKYDAAVAKLQLFPNSSRKLISVYTPLHGTGAVPAERTMKQWGFDSFTTVPNQREPDGHFPTVSKPNPEEPEALENLLKFANEKGAHAGFATDPDSDRLALVSKETAANIDLFSSQAQGDFILWNGNQTGSLMIDFLLEQHQKQNRLDSNTAIVKTIVTSELQTLICKKYGVSIFNTLTGFKWIASLVRRWEESGSANKYLFGTEESFGYMPGTYVRDKDGIAALAMCAEMCDHFLQNNTSPAERLLKIFKEHGAWHESLHTIELGGQSGQQKIQELMNGFRDPSQMPSHIGSKEVVCLEDYDSGAILQRNSSSSKMELLKEKLDFPKSNALIFRLKDDAQVSIRPSGTEPKIKFYFSAKVEDKENPARAYQEAVSITEKFKLDMLKRCD